MIFDLSSVTDGLIHLVRQAWPTAPIWIELGAAGPTFTPTFTGLAPDAVREGNGPQLSMFLYHVEVNNAQEARYYKPDFQHGTAQPVSLMPLALNLYYLLSAYVEGSYVEEQQAMSVAMRVFHANAIVRSDTTANPAWELTLTVEHRSYDELSLLWQATTAPIRLGVVYRAAVVFIPPDPPPPAVPIVETVHATVNGKDTVTVT